MMKKKSELQKLRDRKAYRILSLKVKTEVEAAQFIHDVGFCLLFPLDRGTPLLPSLYDAVCGGQRRLIHDWNEYMQRLWTWKDELAAHKKVYFGKFFKGRPSFISLQMLPYFYTLSGNYGDLEDYQQVYEEGRITQDAKRICEFLFEKGPTPTVHLKREAGFRGKGGRTRFEGALKELQRSLLVVNAGVTQEGSSWPSIIVDLLLRVHPQVVKKSGKIPEENTRRKIARKYFDIAVASTAKDLSQLLGWKKEIVHETLQSLLKKGVILSGDGDLYLSSQID